MRKAREQGLDAEWLSAAPERDAAPEDSVEVKTVEQSLRDEIAGLRRDLKAAYREGASEADVLAAIGRMAAHDVSPPSWLTDAPKRRPRGKAMPEVPVALWSDWHYGEVVQADEVNGFNSYNTEIARERVTRLVDSTINLAQNHMGGNYPGIVVALLGDFISGGLHPELARTDEEGRIEAALSVLDILAGALVRMADAFGQVFCPAVPGNHGRNSHKPEFKEYHKGNFDWLVYQLLARHFEAKGDRRIRFMIPPSGDAHFRVWDLRFMATHGDMLGVRGGDGIIGAIGPIMRGEIKMRGQQVSLSRSYDFLLMGHWHQTLWLPRAFVNNALKGFDEYAAKSLRAVPSSPTQTLFFVHPRRGVTARWDVDVDPPKAAREAGWVSWTEGEHVR